jgi:ribulose-phosphate 3-epimerase
MVEILPGVLEKTWPPIKEKLEVSKCFTKWVHVDFIDDKFTTNATDATFLDLKSFFEYSRDLFIEAHMMVVDPIQYLESLAKEGFKRFIGQIEKMPDQAEFVAKARSLGEVSLAIDGPTPLEHIEVPLSSLDSITVMTIEAGKSGQVFNPKYLEKVEILRSPQCNVKIPIEIDGGVNDRTIFLAKNAGADRFVANSYIFNNQNPARQFNLLKTIAER